MHQLLNYHPLVAAVAGYAITLKTDRQESVFQCLIKRSGAGSGQNKTATAKTWRAWAVVNAWSVLFLVLSLTFSPLLTSPPHPSPCPRWSSHLHNNPQRSLAFAATMQELRLPAAVNTHTLPWQLTFAAAKEQTWGFNAMCHFYSCKFASGFVEL